MNQLGLLITINAGTLVTVIVATVRFIRFINNIEFKTDLMWDDYQKRTGFKHRRMTDR